MPTYKLKTIRFSFKPHRFWRRGAIDVYLTEIFEGDVVINHASIHIYPGDTVDLQIDQMEKELNNG